jgi:hypothetical protein
MRYGPSGVGHSKSGSRRLRVVKPVAFGAAIVLILGLLTLPVTTGALSVLNASASANGVHLRTPAVLTSVSNSCPTGPWPAQVTGVPKVNGGTHQGFYIGANSAGVFSMETTHPKFSPRVFYHFSGTVTTDGTFDNVTAISLEKEDTFSVSPDQHTLTFNFNDGGDIDGLSFIPTCGSSITFSLSIKSVSAPTSRINLGVPSTNPSSNPFTFTRPSQVCGSEQVQSTGPVTATLSDTAPAGTDCKTFDGFSSTVGDGGQNQTLSFNASPGAGDIPLAMTIPWAPQAECQPAAPSETDPLPECAPTQVSLDDVTFTDQTFCASASPGQLCTTSKTYNYVVVDGVTETQITENWVGDVDCCYWKR